MKGKHPLLPMPVIDTPFKRIGIDIVGPLPRTRKKSKYSLIICDYATRFPEAIPLSNVRSDTVVNALIKVFARIGLPEHIIHDQGTNFMSAVMKDMCDKLHIKQINTSAYYPQTNGLTERFHGTLKNMLRSLTPSQMKDWDVYIPHFLFAYREVPSVATGYSPFQLLYGRQVRGPLSVVKGAWISDDGDQTDIPSYLLQMRERLSEWMAEANETQVRYQAEMKGYYDRNASYRVFDTGLTTLVSHIINTTSDAPVYRRAYRIPHALKGKVKSELDSMLKLGVIEPIVSAYASPIVYVVKPGGAIRICTDFRQLTADTNFHPYTMPRIDEILDDISNAKYISTLDLTKGFYQVPLDPFTKEKSSFVTPFGQFCYNVLPFGMQNSSSTFQRLMDEVLMGCRDYGRVYIDDICIFSDTVELWKALSRMKNGKYTGSDGLPREFYRAFWAIIGPDKRKIFSHTFEDHLTHVENVLCRLQDACLTVKPQKCILIARQVSYLGHTVGNGVISPNVDKVQALRDFRTPLTKKQVKTGQKLLRPVVRSSRHGSYIQIACNKNCLKFSFMPKTLIDWNALPQHIKEIEDKDNFKAAVAQHYSQKPITA
ncbi:hypothetical protein BSL78_05044 [Apostichopus japonicus]|uniref:Integrase catalytic domain-containing protein n=1 Tax=Stichopus japonicus TaxID=307972 RepID=A0A2G8LCY1_STIJA|nr:hypothetical protein BSL78_05044 [Apostichopus japonicus]